MDQAAITKVLQDLEDLEANTELSIIKLSEPITSALLPSQDPTLDSTHHANLRTSDASNASLDAPTPTPSSLEADLVHYKELFAKLRFSYVEQVSKEKFIRAIVGEPPLIVEARDNVALERENLVAKARLRQLKLDVAALVAELDRRARELSRRYETVRVETAALRDLPAEMARLEETIAELREGQPKMLQPGGDVNLSLPLGATRDLVEERKSRRSDLERELQQLQARLPRKKKELERLEAELGPLEAKRTNSAAAAKEARRRKEAALGGVEDDLEERGRWWRASETVLKQMLDIQG